MRSRIAVVVAALIAAAIVLPSAQAPQHDPAGWEFRDHIVAIPQAQARVTDSQPCENNYNKASGVQFTERRTFPYFTICFVAGYEGDVRTAERGSRMALATGRTKYGVRRPSWEGEPIDVDVFMYPTTERVSVPVIGNHGVMVCCFYERGGRKLAEIHAVTPSHLVAQSGSLEEEGLLLYNHEMIHVIQKAFDPWGNWGYERLLDWKWVIEGLATYDSYANGTTWAKTTGFWSKFHLATAFDDGRQVYWKRSLAGTGSLATTSEYAGGLVLMDYYADKYGESIHVDFLTNGPPEDEPASTFRDLRDWHRGLTAENPGGC